MKQNIFKSKAGVTILEGVIALGLLALVMAGSFGVLLSSSRQTMQPDIYEEMGFASEKASETLKEYVTSWTLGGGDTSFLEGKVMPHRTTWGGDDGKDYRLGVCGVDNNDLKCLLPPICNMAGSTFEYTRIGGAGKWPTAEDAETAGIHWEGRGNPQMYLTDGGSTLLQRDATLYTQNPAMTVKLDITCNDYKLGDDDE